MGYELERLKERVGCTRLENGLYEVRQRKYIGG